MAKETCSTTSCSTRCTPRAAQSADWRAKPAIATSTRCCTRGRRCGSAPEAARCARAMLCPCLAPWRAGAGPCSAQHRLSDVINTFGQGARGAGKAIVNGAERDRSPSAWPPPSRARPAAWKKTRSAARSRRCSSMSAIPTSPRVTWRPEAFACRISPRRWPMQGPCGGYCQRQPG